MNILNDVRHVGLFQVAQNLYAAASQADSGEILAAAMPMPGADIAPRIQAAADFLLGSGKKKLLLLSPEIAILRALAEKQAGDLVVFVALPADMPAASFAQIRSNIPQGLDVRFVENLYLPGGFLPENGIVVSFGYTAKGYLMVLPETYHMNKVYGSFPGQKLFLPYAQLDHFVQPSAWMRIRADHFDDLWRYDDE